ncbi:hypothetical protein MP228_003642 [Amoeboaphelidium protococcarum]|nr:hypothetical protein MP228_003642 [Amoeboaphelidium protococcarum]
MGMRINLIQHRVPLLCVVWSRLDLSCLLCLLECLLLEVSFCWFICWWLELELVLQCWLVITLATWRRGAGWVSVILKHLWSLQGHELLGVWLVGRCWPQRKAGWLAGGWKGGPVMAIEEKLSGWWPVKANNYMPGKVLGLKWASGPGGVNQIGARVSLIAEYRQGLHNPNLFGQLLDKNLNPLSFDQVMVAGQ